MAKVKTSITLDEALFNKIKEEAEKENRNFTKQLEYMLLKYYEIKKNLI
jgi:hypothetical protein